MTQGLLRRRKVSCNNRLITMDLAACLYLAPWGLLLKGQVPGIDRCISDLQNPSFSVIIHSSPIFGPYVFIHTHCLAYKKLFATYTKPSSFYSSPWSLGCLSLACHSHTLIPTTVCIIVLIPVCKRLIDTHPCTHPLLFIHQCEVQGHQNEVG